MTAAYRKKPVTVHAVRFTGDNHTDVQALCATPEHFRPVPPDDRHNTEIVAEVWDKLHATWVGVTPGQWIVLGTSGETYPVDAAVFADVYEPAPEQPEPAG